ncbi:MAG: CapA family protein [Ilumatobacter sp.]
MRTHRIVAGLVAAVVAAACGTASDPNLAAGGPSGPTAQRSSPVDIATPRPDVSAPNSAAPVVMTDPPTSSSTFATTTTTPPRTVTIAFTGDTLAHSPLWRQAQRNAGGSGFDFTPMFDDIAPVIERADLAICHLETPIAPSDEPFSTDPLYGVPPEIVSAMAEAGFDRCSTASNHALDRYGRGIDRTIEVLEANGLGQSGMARDPAEARPSTFSVEGVSISHLSYTYATNGIPTPPGEPWRTNYIDAGRIIDDARAARGLGAEVVVVSMHWGTEKVTEPNDQQRTVAAAITASGEVDLVVGHHAHVLQPIEQVNGKWVAYGLSNVLSNLPVNDAWPAASQDAAVVEFAIAVDHAGHVTIGTPVVTPTWVDKNNGWVIRDVRAALADPASSDGRRADLERSLERTMAVVGGFVTR